MQTAFAGSNDNFVAWLAGIKRTHRRSILVRVLDLDHKLLDTIENDVVLDANMTIDVSREVVRMLELSLFDVTRSIGWEPDTDGTIPLHLRRMVQVYDRRYIPGIGWLSCPVFTGPVATFNRDGATVSITCEGKERLALGNFGVSRTWAKKTKVVTVIRDMLVMAGEHPARIHLPDLHATIPEKLSVTKIDQIWPQVKKLARSVDRVIFYDARGHVVMRKQPTSASLRVDKNSLCGPARINRAMPELFNRWVVLGPKPKGNKKRVGADIALPAKHAYSAQKLGRRPGGVLKPRWLIHHEEASVKTNAKAVQIAGRRRDEQQRFTQELSFDCLPFPQTEEHDLIRLVDPITGTRLVRVRTLTLPLVEGPMAVGYLRRTTVVAPRPKKKAAKRGGRRG